MWKIIPLAIIQSILLSGGQVLLKFALDKMGKFEMTRVFWSNLLVNWWFLGCGICYALATILWIYILKHFPFSLAYPMISLSYVFGMIAAILFFHEQVSVTRWMGVILIMGGCCLIAK
ncbi:EamA family transporter [Odoribacter sp. OttesenSCG-928-J03]|nr:EamA family transporter [Odoribacter sp. OttesenSCG-928-J03]MDL2331240.1 EamA family transporter [Odoribacter sp. OttesenSCG-928-A06]